MLALPDIYLNKNVNDQNYNPINTGVPDENGHQAARLLNSAGPYLGGEGWPELTNGPN